MFGVKIKISNVNKTSSAFLKKETHTNEVDEQQASVWVFILNSQLKSLRHYTLKNEIVDLRFSACDDSSSELEAISSLAAAFCWIT